MLLKDLSKIKDVHYVVSKLGMIINKYQIVKCMLEIDKTLEFAYNLIMIYRNFIATETIDTAEEKLNTIISQFKEAHIKEEEITK